MRVVGSRVMLNVALSFADSLQSVCWIRLSVAKSVCRAVFQGLVSSLSMLVSRSVSFSRSMSVSLSAIRSVKFMRVCTCRFNAEC